MLYIRYVGRGFSDVFFDFSFTEDTETHFQRDIKQQSSPLNFNGKSVRVLLTDIRSGAGNVLYLFSQYPRYLFDRSNDMEH